MKSCHARFLQGISLLASAGLGCTSATSGVSASADPKPESVLGSKADDAIDCLHAAPGAPLTIPLAAPATRVSGVPGAVNFQAVTVNATVPAGCYQSIRLQYHFTATCTGQPPEGQNWPADCDPYDRIARITLADAGATPLMLIDAMTPFGGERTFEQDITDYGIALAGAHTYKIEIDSFNDPHGAVSGVNGGWNVDAQIIATPGPTPHSVVAVVPALFAGRLIPGMGPLGADLTAPAGATMARLDLYATGHGGVGDPPCDEFCAKDNEVTLDGQVVYHEAPWTSCSGNCQAVPASASFSCGGEEFNYVCADQPTSCPPSPVFDRAGWCPGRQVDLRNIELSPAAMPGTHKLEFSVPALVGFYSVGATVVFFR